MIFPFDKLPALRPKVHICTAENPWAHRELKLNEEVCHPDAKPFTEGHELYLCPHCKGYFQQEQPK